MTDQQTEAEKRDAILDTLVRTRADLIAIAKATALYMAQRDGVVTSVRLIAQLREDGHGAGRPARRSRTGVHRGDRRGTVRRR